MDTTTFPTEIRNDINEQIEIFVLGLDLSDIFLKDLIVTKLNRNTFHIYPILELKHYKEKNGIFAKYILTTSENYNLMNGDNSYRHGMGLAKVKISAVDMNNQIIRLPEEGYSFITEEWINPYKKYQADNPKLNFPADIELHKL